MAEERFTSQYDGTTQDNLLEFAGNVKKATTVDGAETVNVQGFTLPRISDISGFVAVNNAGNAIGFMSKDQVSSVLGELMAIASPQGKGLHPAAKFSQSDNSYTVNIDNIKILSVDIYNGTIGESTGIFVIKTYPASPAYMFQEAIGMYPIVRFWRPKVDGTWRGWREV